jgi:CDP-diglyceride synthetase
MVIDIKRTVIKTQLRRLIVVVFFILVILIVLLGVSEKHTVLGMNKYQWAMIIGLLYFLSIVFESVLELNYIYYSDRDDPIVFRYFSMSIFNKKKNSIEIPKNAFAGYQLISSLKGMKKKIILLQRIKDKIAKYPPVSISSLNKRQFRQLIDSLDKYK